MTGGESLESYYDEATGSDWRDLVKGQADAAIQSDYAVAAEAQKAGWTLQPEDQAAVEEETALIKKHGGERRLCRRGQLSGRDCRRGLQP